MSTTAIPWVPPALEGNAEHNRATLGDYIALTNVKAEEVIRLRMDIENALYLVHSYRKDIAELEHKHQDALNELAEYRLKEQRHKEWLEGQEG